MSQISRDRIAGLVGTYLQASPSELKDETVLSTLGGNLEGALSACAQTYGKVLEATRAQSLTFGQLVHMINR